MLREAPSRAAEVRIQAIRLRGSGMSLDDEQRGFFDGLHDSTDQQIVSAQYTSLILSRLQRWNAEDRPVQIDAIVEWARQRELGELQVGMLAGLALAVNHDGD